MNTITVKRPCYLPKQVGTVKGPAFALFVCSRWVFFRDQMHKTLSNRQSWNHLCSAGEGVGGIKERLFVLVVGNALP